MSGPTRAMIMAAGLGTRMRPLTNDRPKPLVQVRGKALIDHAIDRLVQTGVKMIVVNVHYHADLLKAHLAKRKDVEIRISDESDQLMDSGGGIAKALHHFEGEPFFTHNSDSIWVEGTGQALERLKARWNPDAMDSLMLLSPTVTAVCYEGRGDFMMDAEGHLARVPEQRVAPFVWIGVQILHPRMFEGAPKGKFSINPLWDRAIEKGRLYGIRLDGVWMHIDRPEAVSESEDFLADLAPA
ncbi:MAG TPA: nucleotidyltransferase family protein [Rhizomicrobium sp.]|nr:nucleotidyltransferase family protein [Rhizomicrobium sp.]